MLVRVLRIIVLHMTYTEKCTLHNTSAYCMCILHMTYETPSFGLGPCPGARF